MIGRAHKSATCADSTITLELPIMPTAKETNNLRLKVILLPTNLAQHLFVTPSIPGADLELAVRSTPRALSEQPKHPNW
jgi:hypothetical protein